MDTPPISEEEKAPAIAMLPRIVQQEPVIDSSIENLQRMFSQFKDTKEEGLLSDL